MTRSQPTEAAARPARGKWVAVSASPRGIVAATFPVESRGEALRAVGGEGLNEGPLSQRAAGAVAAYCDKRTPLPEFPLDLEGVPEFAAAVLREVARIPLGETRTYGEVAASCGRPGAARAVGNTMARNWLAPFVPCHRVLARGGWGGYGGGRAAVPYKIALLEWESADVPDNVKRAGSGKGSESRRPKPW